MDSPKLIKLLNSIWRFLLNLCFLLVLILLAVGGWWLYRLASRPSRTNISETLPCGAIYEKLFWKKPQLALIHIVEIDLKKVDIQEILTNPPDSSKGLEHLAGFTTEFAMENEADLAINGSFYTPCHTHRIWDFYPQKGEPVDVFATAVYEGVQYSEPEEKSRKRFVLYWQDKQFKLFKDGEMPEGVQYAIPGGDLLVWNGVAEKLPHRSKSSFQPRTAIGWNEAQSKIWIIVVDGRQPRYSEGVSLHQLANLFVERGANQALNLDGGGSSTLVAKMEGQPKVLNAPIHRRTPMKERPVPNHLGFKLRRVVPHSDKLTMRKK